MTEGERRFLKWQAINRAKILRASHVQLDPKIEAWRRADGRCERCGAGDVQLDRHHRTYDNEGSETIDDFEVLCRPCHDSAHLDWLDEFWREEREKEEFWWNACARWDLDYYDFMGERYHDDV